MISSKYKFIFFRIPKSAGKSIDSSLKEYYVRLTPEMKTKDRSVRGHNFSIHISYRDLFDFLSKDKKRSLNIKQEKVEDYFKFCFVRNPWCRTLSHYNSKAAHLYGSNAYKPHRLKKNFNRWIADKYEGIKFDNRHNTPTSKREIGDYPFLRTQQLQYMTEDMTATGKVAVDFIGRFESFVKDINKLSLQLGVNINLPNKNLGKTKHLHYSHYYTPRSRQIISNLFGEDIEYFGYEYEDRT
jgi:hypothetical protein